MYPAIRLSSRKCAINSVFSVQFSVLCFNSAGYHNRHYTGRLQVSREDQVDQELTG